MADAGGPQDRKPGAASEGADVGDIPQEHLVRLFSRPRPPKELIAGMRALGFSADSVVEMTGAKSRDVVYSWAAGRARPGQEQAQRLDDIRRALLLICSHSELGADSAWLLFNARFAGMDGNGPTALELVGQGRAPILIEHLEALIDDDRNGGDPIAAADRAPEPSPAASRSGR